MYTVKFTNAYKKSYKLMKKRGLDLSLLDEVVDTLRQGKQLDSKYRDHGLSGNFQGFRECHICLITLAPYYLYFAVYAALQIQLPSARHCF